MEKYLGYVIAASLGAFLAWVFHAGIIEIIIVSAILIAVAPVIRKAQTGRKSKASNQNL